MRGGISMKIKKMMMGAMFLLTGTMFLCACGNDESEKMTGYPSGEVQKEYVMVNDAIYCYSGKTQESLEQIEEKGYAKAGEISICDNTKIPEANFTAAQIDEGTIIYVREKDEEYIYLEMEDKELLVFQKQE